MVPNFVRCKLPKRLDSKAPSLKHSGYGVSGERWVEWNGLYTELAATIRIRVDEHLAQAIFQKQNAFVPGVSLTANLNFQTCCHDE